jgi:phosphoglycerate kinase
MKFLTLDDVDVKNKTVILRVDINVPYNPKTKRIEDSERLREHAKTILELSNKKAKIVVLAHQGRKGDPDFIHLDQHAKLLGKHVGKPVKFVDDIIGKKAVEKIKSLKPGEILLLDNVRFLAEETEEKSAKEHSKGRLVQTLYPLADIFVNDAFSAAHRSHASIVGFTYVLKSVAGRVMEKEIKSCEKILRPKHPAVALLGGAKPEECLGMMEYMLKNKSLDIALTSGIVGELFLIANGNNLGKPTMDFFKAKKYLGFIPRAKRLIQDYKDRIFFPVDVAADKEKTRGELGVDELPAKYQLLDIGRKTVENYSGILNSSKTIVVKGPAGVYERSGFEVGTKMILEVVSRSKGFSLICGGDTGVAIEKLGINKKKFSYVSTAGGAMITYLSGKTMPGIDTLRRH